MGCGNYELYFKIMASIYSTLIFFIKEMLHFTVSVNFKESTVHDHITTTQVKQHAIRFVYFQSFKTELAKSDCINRVRTSSSYFISDE